MISLSELRDRYVRDHPTVRLGNLASSLGRLSLCLREQRLRQTVPLLLRECKHLIEWVAPDVAGVEAQAELAGLQLLLVRWERAWHRAAAPLPAWCEEASGEAAAWSERVMALGGGAEAIANVRLAQRESRGRIGGRRA